MIRFEDYHRTIVGYHGTRLSVALDIINRRKGFEFSENEGDWLGHGVYFWEYAPQQALWWANRLKKRAEKSRRSEGKPDDRRPWDEPIAILGSMIRLGFCLDLLDPYNIRYAKKVHDRFCDDRSRLRLPIPKNRRHRRDRDCAVFQYLYTSLEEGGARASRVVDTARAVYVTTDEKKRIWPGSWIYDDSHIQVCVRNPACILGTWLHYPSSDGGTDGIRSSEVAEVGVESPDRAGRQAIGEDVPARADSAPGQGEAADPGTS